jgi:heme-degrading monooxygenase HmoA
MHARVTTIQMDPARIDDAVRGLRENDIPQFEQIDGFKGFTLLVDREGGKAIGTSFWESADAMHASDEQVKGARQRAAEAGGASAAPQVELYEVAIDTMV